MSEGLEATDEKDRNHTAPKAKPREQQGGKATELIWKMTRPDRAVHNRNPLGRRDCSERKRERSIPGRRLEGAEDSNPHHSELEKLQTDEERNERILHRDEMKWEKPAGFSIHIHVMCVPQGLMRRRRSNPGCVLSLKKKRKTVFMGEKGHQE